MRSRGLILTPVLTLMAMVSLATGRAAISAEQETVDVSAATPPNIILVMADDLGFGDVGFNGSEIRTPVIDDLAASGLRFDRHYTYAICSPTRAALMTGRHAFETGVDGPVGLDTGLPTHYQLLPEFLRQVGYRTALVGKWHLGAAATKYFPQQRGFDTFYGILHGFADHYTHITPRGELDWQRDGSSVREEGHSTDLLTDEAINIIEQRDASKPLFLFLSYTAPHTPLQAPDAIAASYDHIDDPLRREFAGMVEQMDSALGRVIETLEHQSMLDNTVIIFLSDNGGNVHAGANNGGLRLGKGTASEGGIRVPAVATWPNVIKAGTSVAQPVSIHDWMPTLLDIAGVSADASQWYGQSLLPLLLGKTSAPRPFVVGARRPAQPRQVAVIDWPWKLLGIGERDKLEATRLFNLADDPSENTDLLSAHPEVVERLLSELRLTPDSPSIAEQEAASHTRGAGPLRWLSGYTEELLPPVAEAARDD